MCEKDRGNERKRVCEEERVCVWVKKREGGKDSVCVEGEREVKRVCVWVKKREGEGKGVCVFL